MLLHGEQRRWEIRRNWKRAYHRHHRPGALLVRCDRLRASGAAQLRLGVSFTDGVALRAYWACESQRSTKSAPKRQEPGEPSRQPERSGAVHVDRSGKGGSRGLGAIICTNAARIGRVRYSGNQPAGTIRKGLSAVIVSPHCPVHLGRHHNTSWQSDDKEVRSWNGRGIVHCADA